MKRTILTLTMIIAACGFVFGQSKAEQEIRKMFEMTAGALVKNDLSALSNHFADDLTFTIADGRVFNKTQFFDYVKNTKRESLNFSELTVRQFGNTAVVNFTRTSTVVNGNGTKSNSQSRDTATLVKTGKGWRIVALQVSNEQAGNQAGGNDEQEIRQTLNTIAEALVKNDVATLSNHYADSYTFTNERGVTTNKTQRLEGAKTARLESFSYNDMNIRVFGNTAVAVINPTFTTIGANGQKTNVKDRATLTLVKTNGRWQIVAIQTSSNLLNQAGSQAETEKQIGEMMTNWGNALGQRDAAAVEKILPADFMLVSPDGKIYTSRAEYLEVVKNFPGEATITGKSEKTIVSGDTAVQSGTYSVTPKASGANTMNFKYTATFVHRNGRWMPIAFNSRPMPQK